MAVTKITLTVEGLHAEDGHVRLSSFYNELKEINSALKIIDREVSGGEQANYFRIVSLTHSSPAAVGIEVATRQGMRDTRKALVNSFINTTRRVHADELPHDVNYRLLEHLRNLARGVGQDFESVSITCENEHIDLTRSLVSKIDAHLSNIDYCFGTVDGALEQCNVHKGVNTFHIYPDIGPGKVKCNFKNEHIDDAISAIRKYVSVSGLLKYRKNDDYPYEIDVEDIEIFPPEEELPTFEDLRGLAPDAAGGIPSEEYIRELRDGWEQ